MHSKAAADTNRKAQPQTEHWQDWHRTDCAIVVYCKHS